MTRDRGKRFQSRLVGPAVAAYITLGPMRTPGPLLAAGRDADIFEYGPGLVLRRSREGHVMTPEARVMDYARAQGFPVPAVEEVSNDGLELVMERIDGVDMVTAMSKRPWTIGYQGEVLAELHQRLHQIAAPAWVAEARVGRGEHLVHLDLHPLNVILGPNGPVVIDWSNAARGDPDVDVALAWVLMAAGSVPTNRLVGVVLERARSTLVRGFLSAFDTANVARRLGEVVAFKVQDPHMSSAEQACMWRLVDEVDAATRAEPERLPG
jgi:aminoglycoside phosphotransferase (APT) family kinase protein